MTVIDRFIQLRDKLARTHLHLHLDVQGDSRDVLVSTDWTLRDLRQAVYHSLLQSAGNVRDYRILLNHADQPMHTRLNDLRGQTSDGILHLTVTSATASETSQRIAAVPAVEVMPDAHADEEDEPLHTDQNIIYEIGLTHQIDNGESGTSFKASEFPAVIGRQGGENVTIDLSPLPDSIRVSRQHARIDYTDGAFTITKLADRNKLAVNDLLLDANQPHPLQHGDMLRLGQVILLKVTLNEVRND